MRDAYTRYGGVMTSAKYISNLLLLLVIITHGMKDGVFVAAAEGAAWILCCKLFKYKR